ncbi:hypothetical protein X975_13821, partial [Stegodyphus mimosarum]
MEMNRLLFGERYPMRRQPNHQMFAWVHQNLVEHGSFRARIEGIGRPQRAQTPIFEKGVLHAVDQNPCTSVQVLAIATGRSQNNCPLCTAEQNLTCVSCTESAVITAR